MALRPSAPPLLTAVTYSWSCLRAGPPDLGTLGEVEASWRACAPLSRGLGAQNQEEPLRKTGTVLGLGVLTSRLGCPGHCGMIRPTSGLNPLDASSTAPAPSGDRNVSGHCHVRPGDRSALV